MRQFLFLFLFLFTLGLLAQEPSTIHLTEKDGLPDIEFYDLYTDSKGVVWLAADKGLYKYNGKDFINYTHPEKRGLSVFNIKEDKEGRIWCRNITGQIFYVKDDVMHLFHDFNIDRYGEYISFFFKEDNIILLGLDFHYVFNISTKERLYAFKEPGFHFQSVAFQYDGSIYGAVGDSLVNLTNYNQIRTVFRNEELFEIEDYKKYFHHNEQVFVFRQKEKNEFLLFDIEANKVYPIDLPQELAHLRCNNLISLDGFIWFCTNSGVYQYQLVDNKLIYKNEFLGDYFTSDITIDHNQNFWVSTLDAGVFVIPNIHIRRYKLPLQANNIRALKNYKNEKLLIGSFNGSLASYDPTYQQYQLLYKDNAKVSDVVYIENKDIIFSSNDLRGFISSEKHKKHVYSLANLKDISLVNDSTFLVASYNRGEIFRLHDKAPWTSQRTLNVKRAYSTYYDTFDKSYYVGNTDHLRRYSPSFEERKILYNKNPIFALDIDATEDGVKWVTTDKYGVLGIKNDTVVASFNTSNGLPTNHTSFLFAEGVFLWVVTQEGIAYINTLNQKVEVFTQQDGIPSYKIYEITSIDDLVFFASNEGLFSIDNNKAFIYRPLPKVALTHVYIEDKEVPIASQYNLTHDNDRIEIQFQSNGFQTDKNIRYEYRLSNEQTPWEVLQEGVNNVTFSNLAYGNYNFMVRARNKFNQRVSIPKRIKFSIAPPIWKRWWFIALTIGALMLLVALYFKKLHDRKEKEKDLEVARLQLSNQLTSLKLENLRSQMNPHFIFNALNSIQEYIILNKKDLASDYLGKFADLVRTYLKHSSKGTITLQEEIDCLEMYLELEKLRFEDTLTYHIEKSDEVHPEEVSIPTMLVQPYVENAIKHGLLHKSRSRLLEVFFTYSSDYRNIICTVQDNGVGRVKAMQLQAKRGKNHQSFSTKANEDRLVMINQGKDKKIGVVIEDLYDEEQNSLGTKIIITIPFTKE